MSLNRSEQALYEYIRGHPEERQHFTDKVRAIVAASAETAQAVARIDTELWRYYEERSAVVPIFREEVMKFGLRRTSMKNLAEYLVRIWVEPKPRKPSPSGLDPLS
jgi:hypothetical protein